MHKPEWPNGLRYPRWGGRRDAVRLGKGRGVEKGLESRQTPQRRVHALLGTVELEDSLAIKSVLTNFTTTCELKISLAHIFNVLGVLLPVFFGKHKN